MKYLQNNNLEVNSSVRGENTVLRPAFSLSHLNQDVGHLVKLLILFVVLASEGSPQTQWSLCR